ncbi:hypothetical protein D3C75_787970 [compost metagenome]
MVAVQPGAGLIQAHAGDKLGRDIGPDGQLHMGTGLMGIGLHVADPIRSGLQICDGITCYPGPRAPIVGGPFHESIHAGDASVIGVKRCFIRMLEPFRRSLRPADHHRFEVVKVDGGIGITVDAEQLANQLGAACMAEVVIGGYLNIIDIDGILLVIPVGHHLDVVPGI